MLITLHIFRFYKLHERKCEPIIMTVPRKVSLFMLSNLQAFLSLQGLFCVFCCVFLFFLWPYLSLFPLCFFPHDIRFVLCPVGPVPGRPVSRHGRPRSFPGGRRVVCWKERRPHPDLAQRRLRFHQEPRPESGQDERPGDQASAKSRNHLNCPEACYSTVLSGECLLKTFILVLHKILLCYSVSCIILTFFSISILKSVFQTCHCSVDIFHVHGDLFWLEQVRKVVDQHILRYFGYNSV